MRVDIIYQFYIECLVSEKRRIWRCNDDNSLLNAIKEETTTNKLVRQFVRAYSCRASTCPQNDNLRPI
jgi:hypothetical protein